MTLPSSETATPAAALGTKYEPHAIEPKWYAEWERSGAFTADPGSPKPPFSIVIPPPNVTGSLHIGHALNNTLQDILCRRKRMQGFDVLWVPGCDHAGIATQNVVERQLAKEKKTRHDLGREAFVQRVWQWKEQYGGTIMHQLRQLGCSLDWSRERFTMDAGLSAAVREVFVELYQEGLIFQGDYIINWCPRCLTALSDIETEHQDTSGHFWHIRYPLASGQGHLVVATTRPETLLGDAAVAVHPEDERYASLVGQKVRLPLTGREIPVIADAYVDKSFGTGALKITPAHDPNDFTVGERHGLPRINVLNPDATLSAAAGVYAGLDRYEARKRVLADLEEQGLLERTEDHAHAVGHCYRCHTVVEPYLSRQWFVRSKPLAEAAIAAYDQGRIGFTPASWGKVFRDWLENIRDWCISRQIWWGHRIPVWYCDACREVIVSKTDPASCPKCGGAPLRQDEDVLDTWFSSALWPFSTLGWPQATPELAKYYPTSVLVTSWDIIFFWVARMAMLGLHFRGEVPFGHVAINSLVADAEGKKMSKSKGNTVDPLDLMAHTGADGLRFTMAAIENHSRYVSFTPDKLESSRNFMNKIWNASRFAFLQWEGYTPPAQAPEPDFIDRWVLSRLEQVVADVNASLEGYRFGEAAQRLYAFVWHEFCDWYVEMTKPRLLAGGQAQAAARFYLLAVWDELLRLLHPFIPFITEEIWSRLPGQRGLLVRAAWPVSRPERRDPAAESEMQVLQDAVYTVRNLRGEFAVPADMQVTLLVRPNPGQETATRILRGHAELVRALGRIERLEIDPGLAKPKQAAHAWVAGHDLYVPLAGLIDLGKARQQKHKQIEHLEQVLARQNAKLENAGFVAKAPAEVVQEERRKLADYQKELGQLRLHLHDIQE